MSECMDELPFRVEICRRRLAEIPTGLDALLADETIPEDKKLGIIRQVEKLLTDARWQLPRVTSQFQFTKLNALPDEHGPLIYVWRVAQDVYVGKSKNGLRRADREYRNNIRKLLAGEPYRKGKPGAWRKIHVRLAAAVQADEQITLELHPTTLDTLNADEQRLIRELGATLNGGRPPAAR